MLYSTAMPIGPTQLRMRYTIPHDEGTAIRVLGLFMSTVAESSIGVGQFGLWGFSLAEFPAATLPVNAIEWHNTHQTEGIASFFASTPKLFMTGTIGGQNNPAPFNMLFKKGFTYAGDLFAYTVKDGAGPSLTVALTFEYETFKVNSALRRWLHKNVGD